MFKIGDFVFPRTKEEFPSLHIPRRVPQLALRNHCFLIITVTQRTGFFFQFQAENLTYIGTRELYRNSPVIVKRGKKIYFSTFTLNPKL